MTVAAVSPDVVPLGRRFIAWGALVRAVGLAGDARKLVLGLVGLALLIGGWRLIDRVPGLDARTEWAIQPGLTIRLDEATSSGRQLRSAAWLVSEPPRTVVGPFVELFSRGVGPQVWFKALAMGVWSLAVWGIIGGAIARIAAIQLTVGGGVGIASALRFAVGRWVSLIGAPLTPFLAVFVLAAGTAAFGLLRLIPAGIGPTIVGVLGFVPLIAGVVMALILIGLALGWPLMHATVATEGEDVADALSRSYSYVNQRGIRYLAHLAVAWGLGIVGLIAAIVFARIVLHLADWSATLVGPDRPMPGLAATLGFWGELVGWVTHAYLYSYFWSSIAVVYLILRNDVDGTDPHDVFLPEQLADPFAGAPPEPPPAPAATD